MITRGRILLALGAFFVLALVLAACGGVPGNGVARVDDAVITKRTFDHWIKVAAAASQPPTGAGAPSIPDAPKFTKCIAQKSAQQKPTKGQPRQTAAQLKAQCQQEYSTLRDQVMSFLISAQWIQGEARDQGVKVSNKEVQKDFDRQKRQSFPKEADFQKFLQTSAMSLADLRLQVKLGLLRNKIRTKVTKAKKASDKQVAAYYEQNKTRPPIGQPQRRDVLIVLTKTAAKAKQAKSALAGGKSFTAVAKQFSIDPATKNSGGKLTVSKGQQEQSLDAAVFTAKLNQLTGPVKSQFGYYVFKVTKDTAGSQQTLAQATPTIRRTLMSQSQQTALQKFVDKFQKKWKSRTDCAKDFRVMNCKNAPKQPAGGAGGAVPQGGGAQPVPQGGGAQPVPQGGGAQQVPAQ